MAFSFGAETRATGLASDLRIDIIAVPLFEDRAAIQKQATHRCRQSDDETAGARGAPARAGSDAVLR